MARLVFELDEDLARLLLIFAKEWGVLWCPA